jgi:hypothetical protein
MVRVSWSARCFSPRSCRAVPSSVQAVPARKADAAKTIDRLRATEARLRDQAGRHDRTRITTAGDAG